MEPTEIHELTAAYALDALDAGRGAGVRGAPAHCPQCREELAALPGDRGGAGVRGRGPRRLRRRSASGSSTRRRERAAERRPAAARALGRSRVGAAAAAGGRALRSGSASGRRRSRSSLDEERAAGRTSDDVVLVLISRAANRRTSRSRARTARSSSHRTRQAALVAQTASSARPTDKTYEAWVIEGGDAPQPAGIFDGRRRHARSSRSPSPVPAGAVVAVTVEPDGGVDQRRRPSPFVVAERPTRAGLARSPGGPAVAQLQSSPSCCSEDASRRAAAAAAADPQAPALRPAPRPRLCCLAARSRSGSSTAIAQRHPVARPGEPGATGCEKHGYIYAADGKTVLAVLRGDEAASSSTPTRSRRS